MSNNVAVFNADYSYQTINADVKDIQINCNSVSFENSGATVCYIAFNGTKRPIKPKQTINYNHDFDTKIIKTVAVNFVTGLGELIITEETLNLL